ncbi:Glycine betaine/choline transport system permease protein OusW, partial [Geodia barretti]
RTTQGTLPGATRGAESPRFALSAIPSPVYLDSWSGLGSSGAGLMPRHLGPGDGFPDHRCPSAVQRRIDEFPQVPARCHRRRDRWRTKVLTTNGRWLFEGIKDGITYALLYIEGGLKWLPWPAVVLGLVLAAFAVGRWGLMAFAGFAFLFIGFMGLWEPTMDTIALMVVAVILSVGIGLPLGVVGARNQTADRIMRPILDGMQTMPSFVYLIPGILFFGLGKPAGIFATIIYAVPPVIRLTNLGIRQVSPETVEAARSFGASPLQILSKVQIPMALPTIMAGINQTTMMALAMVTIASMVAAGGLGDNVLRAIQKNEVGNGVIAGLSIVFMAIVIDRLTQAVARSRQEALQSGN